MSPAGASTTLEMNRSVRQILVANWIDLGRVSVRSVKDSVYMRGTLQKLPGAESLLNAAQVKAMYDKIRTIKAVKHVRVEFDNWFLNPSTGTWETAHDRNRRSKDAAAQSQQKEVKRSYRID